MPATLYQHLSESATVIRSHASDDPEQEEQFKIDAAIVLGSGLGDFAETLYNRVVIPYKQIPHFHESAIAGHAGNLVIGDVYADDGQALKLACMQGRFHYYEGHDMAAVTFPIRVFRHLGAETLVVTNAAGGINTSFKPGSLMIIEDHLNLMGGNPLRGENPVDHQGQPLGPRFPDMTKAYDAELRRILSETAERSGVSMVKGVYAGLQGPCYETPAEVRMLRALGADAVGMSTVPEVIVARHQGMRVLGISCITNAAAGTSDQTLCHQEVMDTANQVKAQFISLLEGFFKTLAARQQTVAS